LLDSLVRVNVADVSADGNARYHDDEWISVSECFGGIGLVKLNADSF
jgi:hypothetical protein